MKMKLALTVVLLIAGALPGSVWGQTVIPANRGDTAVAPFKKSMPLVPNDMVLVEVYQESDMEARRRVGQDGTIMMPYLGRVSVGGQTAEQVQTQIQTALAKDYLVNPRVTVTVLEHAKWTFTVLGEVQRPGAYDVEGGEPINVVRAIAIAGGAKSKGQLKKVTVMRTVGQANQVFDLNVVDMMRDPKAEIFEIMPGDIIRVAEKVF